MNMIEKRKAMAGQGGFTLIELLVVIAILAVLGGAAIIGIGAMRTNAENQACKNEKSTVQTGLEALEVQNDLAAGAATIADAETAGLIRNADPTDWTVTHTATGGYAATPAAGGKYDGVTCA